MVLLLVAVLGIAGLPGLIDRKQVIERHLVRLNGVGGLSLSSTGGDHDEQVEVEGPGCRVEGRWWDAHDAHRRDEFTVGVDATFASLCPVAGLVHSYNASTQHAWKNVPLCVYTNRSLWIGRTGAHAAYQTGQMDSSCASLTWGDPPPLTAQYHWCREPGTSSCFSGPPSPTGPTQPKAPQTLTLGNGAVGFNADMTGFQSLNSTYTTLPLTTLSDWGWHSSPYQGPSPFDIFQYTDFQVSSGRNVPYPLNQQQPGGAWLRSNPHRLDLIQVALRKLSAPSTPLVPADLDLGVGSVQELNPWTGELSSNFTTGGGSLSYLSRTAMMMDLDVISWKLQWQHSLSGKRETEPDTALEPLAIRVAFPYGSEQSNGPGHDWTSDSKHSTTVVKSTADSALLKRVLDFDSYEVLCRWSDPSYTWAQDGPHAFLLKPRSTAFIPSSHDDGDTESSSIELSCLLSPPGARYPINPTADWLTQKHSQTSALLATAMRASASDLHGEQVVSLLPLYNEVAAAAAESWSKFWLSGAFVDLGKDDPRAIELERRVVLSQYLTRSQSAGSLPPQETGYTLNSWYGKYHHEMRWWHQAHFGLWQRPELLQRSDGWYVEMLPNATAYATNQGYKGARWPKMVGPETTLRCNPHSGGAFNAPSVGQTDYSNSTSPLLYHTGPSRTGPMLIWQQPHIIWMSEQQRLHAPSPTAATAVVRRMSQVVEATADFMASYPSVPPASGQQSDEVTIGNVLWLGPPTDGGEEGNPQNLTWNPTFELTYWRLGLKIASEWRARAHLPPKPEWEDTLKRLAEPTTIPSRDNYSSAYAVNGNCYGFPHSAVPKPGQHKCSGAYQSHPLFLGALGMINGAAVQPPLDSQTFNSTLRYSITGWDWSSTWGWDYPLWAFAQMRMGWDSSSVVDMLLRNETKNFYWNNGHDYETPSLPVYLPGNGGLLSAVAMMAGGFLDAHGKPVEVGFPESWGAVAEGFKPFP